VVWGNGQTWEGVKVHMGYNQEAFDAECAALARALESVAGGYIPERVTIFSDAQAAIRRMASDEPGPGQQYAIQARKHIAALRMIRPSISIEIRWCPAHKGIAGNEQADEWAKMAAEKPGTRGVELLPLPRSLASLKREISEKKWAEARAWAGGRTSKKKYKMPTTQRPNEVVAGSTKSLASRFYQLKTGHCRTGQYLHWTGARPTAQCWWCKCPTQTRDHLLKECPKWKDQQRILWKEVWKETGRGKRRWKGHELFADVTCSRAVLDFLSATDVGRLVPPLAEEGDAVSEVSEWSSGRGGSGRKKGRRRRRRWVPRMRWARGRNPRCSFPPPRSWPRLARSRGLVGRSFLCLFLCHFLGAIDLSLSGQARAEG